ncbi:MAG: 30S ribosomal protein S15 [Parcubacteria group bacterium Gr01-1014_2]|nr:MAG: 30S ribosomal protein S15 [Parcubacteria group bacterium Gr01-1014_2]
MALIPKEKTKIIQKHSLHGKDTGSSEIQAALFTEEIKRLIKHLKDHPKDHSSRRGLLKIVSKRKRLLDWLKKEDPKKYSSITKELGLRK